MRIRCVFIAVLIALLGHGCGRAQRAHQHQEAKIIEGVSIYGRESYYTTEQVVALKEAAASLDPDYPVMSIQFIDRKTAEVTTGVIRGPLDGGGRIYRFTLTNGKWSTDGSVTYWIS